MTTQFWQRHDPSGPLHVTWLKNHSLCTWPVLSCQVSCAAQVPAKSQRSSAQKGSCCKCAKRLEAAVAVSNGAREEEGSSRRAALLAGVSVAATFSGTVSDGEALAAADAYEIPENQQCIECTGSGIISCAHLFIHHDSTLAHNLCHRGSQQQWSLIN